MKSFISIYGWREPWGKIQDILLTKGESDLEEDTLLPNKYELPEIGYNDNPGKLIFDIDRERLMWDYFGFVIRNERAIQPVKDKCIKETEIDLETLINLRKHLRHYLKDKKDLRKVLTGKPKLYLWSYNEDLKLL